jgi:uncharacterized protein
MPAKPLSLDEKMLLLQIARAAMESAVNTREVSTLDLSELSPPLRSKGATFVTLTVGGVLRGCIGALEAYQPLALDVQEHAAAAALEDYRFPQVIPSELKHISIEVSRLTPPVKLDYVDMLDLLQKLHPGVDGVILKSGTRRATFLPQVWDKIPDPASFLDQLSYKMGALPEIWRKGHPEILIYQVEEFHE